MMLPELVARLYRRAHGGTFNYAVQVTKKDKETTMLEITLTNEQKVKVTCNPVTAAGNPAPLDGAVSFEIQAGEGSVETIDDRSVFLVSGDNPGDAVFLVEADADLGDGIETIADTITLHVEGARASSLGLVADPPVAK